MEYTKGRNLIAISNLVLNVWITSSGGQGSSVKCASTEYIPVEPNSVMTLQYWQPENSNEGNDRAWSGRLLFFDNDKKYLGGYAGEYFSAEHRAYTVTTPEACRYVRATYQAPLQYHGKWAKEETYSALKWKLEYGSEATEWRPAPEDKHMFSEGGGVDFMILARNIIALARINDVTGTTYYYKSQVSTAAKPAKPTAATPSGWSTTEPAYNAANSVYVTVKTTYSDNSFSYSDVSLASAYEGAKEAHNTAASAKSTADEAQASALTAYNTAMNAMPKYTTCTTAEGTTAKVTGTVQNLTKPLVLGQKVAVTFSKKNTATAPTLNVSGTGAYPIRTSNGSALPKTNVEDSSEVGWGANSLVTFVFDGQYWRMDDADALTKIDNILTKNIVGTNGWINLGEGEFVFSDADTGDSIGFNDGVLNLTGTINGSVIQGEDLNIEGEGYVDGYKPTPGELVIVPKYRYWLRTKKAYYTDTDENDNETTYPYKYLQIVTNVQRATLAEVLAELSVEFSPFFGLEVNASPLGGYGDLFSVTDGGATRLVFRSNYDDYTQKDYTDLVLEGPDPRLVIDDSITVSGNVHVDGELTAKPKSQSRSIQTVSGITVGSLQVYTSAGFCAVTLELTSKTTLSDWTTIATGMPIPAVTWYDTMTNWENAYHRPYRVAVTTSGNLNIRYGAGSSSDATAYRISFVYPMAT